MIRRLLVANRGEIALRVMRTAAAMGIDTVAVHSEGDADAPFVRAADRAVALGGREAAGTYLDSSKLLDAARRTGADAIHPGYGFLSENSEFAAAVIDAGLIWVGPSPAAIAAMADKLAAKQLMAAAGVPVLTSTTVIGDGAVDPTGLVFPVLVKAAAGGGGKGMRIVHDPGELSASIRGARRESLAAFGDDTVFLERYVTGARHVEVQILGDLHGNVVHCFERDCSVQRRHQKILEEAPAPTVSPELRNRLGADAVRAAEAIGYHGAGTVEFLLLAQDYYFLEVNTRLQVEHPVSEAITGLDLVREQLLIACGQPLAFQQEDLTINGHAVEARLYAEDPARDFLPATGTVHTWRFGADADVRIDSGVETGSVVSADFDPMLAKVIAHAPTRAQAVAKLSAALARARIHGITTNRDYLVGVLRDPLFLDGGATTAYVDLSEVPRKRPAPAGEIHRAAVAAALAGELSRHTGAAALGHLPPGWSNGQMPPQRVGYDTDVGEIEVSYTRTRDGTHRVQVAGSEFLVRAHSDHCGELVLVLDDMRIPYTVAQDGVWCWVHGPDGEVALRERPRFPQVAVAAVAGGLRAPMPGSVIELDVKVGDRVSEGQPLLVLEAMKMEHRVRAPREGWVRELRVGIGSQVANDELLLVLEAAE
jgi:acetyl/propionyl-CoA carboxylase alpha subunit